MSSAESFVIMENYTQRGAMPQEFISYLPQFPVHFMSNSSRFDPTLQSWVTWKQILTILALQILALYYHAKVKTLGNKKHSVSTQADGNLLSCSAESASPCLLCGGFWRSLLESSWLHSKPVIYRVTSTASITDLCILHKIDFCLPPSQ